MTITYLPTLSLQTVEMAFASRDFRLGIPELAESLEVQRFTLQPEEQVTRSPGTPVQDEGDSHDSSGDESFAGIALRPGITPTQEMERPASQGHPSEPQAPRGAYALVPSVPSPGTARQPGHYTSTRGRHGPSSHPRRVYCPVRGCHSMSGRHSFDSHRALGKHWIKVHMLATRIFQCPDCSMRAQKHNRIKEHMEKEHRHLYASPREFAKWTNIRNCPVVREHTLTKGYIDPRGTPFPGKLEQIWEYHALLLPQEYVEEAEGAARASRNLLETNHAKLEGKVTNLTQQNQELREQLQRQKSEVELLQSQAADHQRTIACLKEEVRQAQTAEDAMEVLRWREFWDRTVASAPSQPHSRPAATGAAGQHRHCAHTHGDRR